MRSMTDAAAAQTVARQIRCALFAELHFLSSIERAWSGYGPLAWNGIPGWDSARSARSR